MTCREVTAQHFLLSKAARTLSIKRVIRMTEEEAHATFVHIRFAENDGLPFCVWCGHRSVYTITRRMKDTATDQARTRTLFRCKDCLRQFSVTSRTIFHGRKLAYTDILHAIACFVNGAKGVSALQISRDVNVQYKTAFVLLHKLREAVGDLQIAQRLRGEVEIDATYVGGHKKPTNKVSNRVDRRRVPQTSGKRRSLVIIRERGKGGRSVPFVGTEKEAVIALPYIIAPGTVIYADEAKVYNVLHARYDVRRIDHTVEYARDGVSTNLAESYWSRLKRSYHGVHHRFSTEHLGAYHAEMSWREDNRRRANGDQFNGMIAAALGHPVSRRWKGYWQRRAA
ncbi:IS1595 family transposase [Sphingomonas oryzagri]